MSNNIVKDYYIKQKAKLLKNFNIRIRTNDLRKLLG